MEKVKKIFGDKILLNLLKTACIILICTVISCIFDKYKIKEENIIMMYITGVLMVVLETKKYVWGIISSIICVFTFNFFFTNPTLTFMVEDPNYIITFIMFLIVSFITSTLTSKLQRQVKKAENNVKQTTNTYEMSKSYLNISGVDNIAYNAIKSLYGAYKVKSLIYLVDEDGKLSNAYYLKEQYIDKSIIENNTIAEHCFSNCVSCGPGTSNYSNSKWIYKPIVSSCEVFGVIAIEYGTEGFNKEENIFINTNISQMTLAIEREILYSKQQKTQVEVEKEKLRSNLLRSISHDLRTPLTAIAGSSSFIIDSYDKLDDTTIKSLLEDISNDAIWLNKLVENLLNMTRIQDGKLIIEKEMEVIDDIITEAYRRVSKSQKDHRINIKIPEDIVLVPMDGKLIIQVIINLLDNAIKHTPKGTEILLNVYKSNKFINFEVSDDGGGIKKEVLDKIFESFVSVNNLQGDSSRGIGIGLNICKSIVEAHGGEIKGFNNDIGGATFLFKLPI